MFKEIILSLALSNHVGFDNSYNEIHPHIRFKTDNTISGAFYNSDRTISFYTGKEFKPEDERNSFDMCCSSTENRSCLIF